VTTRFADVVDAGVSDQWINLLGGPLDGVRVVFLLGGGHLFTFQWSPAPDTILDIFPDAQDERDLPESMHPENNSNELICLHRGGWSHLYQYSHGKVWLWRASKPADQG
jgi:hypothetical protein